VLAVAGRSRPCASRTCAAGRGSGSRGQRRRGRLAGRVWRPCAGARRRGRVRSSSSCGVTRRRARRPGGRHRHRAGGGEIGLAGAGVLAAHVRVRDPDALGAPVDVAPTQPSELGATQAGHRRGADQDAKRRPEHVRRWRRSGSAAAATERRRLAIDDLVGDRRITASSCSSERKCRSGSTSPPRRRFGRTAQRATLVRAQPRSTACSHTAPTKSMLWRRSRPDARCRVHAKASVATGLAACAGR
jgi:hypothetical protein